MLVASKAMPVSSCFSTQLRSCTATGLLVGSPMGGGMIHPNVSFLWYALTCVAVVLRFIVHAVVGARE